MDSIIQVLPENLIQKIAAGEVIERPASVVKELVENAVDAGATRIRVEIKAGGKQQIMVIDNGQGMQAEDAQKCILRHATSKLSSPSDLFAINTLGFRGEALSSIGAISRLTIQTRHAASKHGTRVAVEGGIVRECTMCGRDIGTTIQVDNLFFNTPARRKFLRHEDTETRHIARLLTHLSVAYPGVGFQLINRGHEMFHYPPADFRRRAGEILGLAATDMLHQQQQDRGIGIELGLSQPHACGKTKQKQFLMVRNRPVYATALSDAVYKGFGALLVQGRHPLYVLALDLDPKLVDVNVHPAKREVRFADEALVADLIYQTVRQCLDIPETAGFVYTTHPKGFAPVQIVHDQPIRVQPGSPQDQPLFDRRPITSEHLPEEAGQTTLKYSPDQTALSLPEQTLPETGKGQGTSAAWEDEERLSSCWQLHQKYIVAQTRDGVAFVHQQRAHERILYEDFLQKMAQEGLTGQRLLFPLTLQLTAADLIRLNQTEGLWQKLGFEIRAFGQDTVIVDAVPTYIEGKGEENSIRALLAVIEQAGKDEQILAQNMARAMAQKASIKVGIVLQPLEMHTLLKDLFNAQDPFICPQGKLIVIRMELKEIDQLLGAG